MIDVRKNLKAIIGNRGISQKKLAIEVGMEQNALSNWLNYQGDASLQKITEICEALGISVVDALTYPVKYVPEDQVNPACEECKRKDEIIDNLQELLRKYKQENKKEHGSSTSRQS